MWIKVFKMFKEVFVSSIVLKKFHETFVSSIEYSTAVCTYITPKRFVETETENEVKTHRRMRILFLFLLISRRNAYAWVRCTHRAHWHKRTHPHTLTNAHTPTQPSMVGGWLADLCAAQLVQAFARLKKKLTWQNACKIPYSRFFQCSSIRCIL